MYRRTKTLWQVYLFHGVLFNSDGRAFELHCQLQRSIMRGIFFSILIARRLQVRLSITALQGQAGSDTEQGFYAARPMQVCPKHILMPGSLVPSLALLPQPAITLLVVVPLDRS